MELNQNELLTINGGVNWKIVGGIVVTLISFISGVVDGFTHPKACSLKGKKSWV